MIRATFPRSEKEQIKKDQMNPSVKKIELPDASAEEEGILSSRLAGVGEYYFSRKLREIEELNKQGKEIINLGIGSPDLPPHPDVIRVLQEESAKANTHAYQSYKGSAFLRKAIAQWYGHWYQVELDPETEILPLIGSKEGILHICMTYLNPGDRVLLPNPGYPTYRSAVQLAGGIGVDYELKKEKNWFPDFDQLEKEIESSQSSGVQAGSIKLMWVNYPQMPTGQLPNRDLFEKLVDFGRKHAILICHDNPYSFILNESPMSLMSIPGAREVALELNSLSKSQNMAGWRVGMLVGKKHRIDQVLRFKSNMDSGMFLPVQLAAAKALSLPGSWYEGLNRVYRKRRDYVYELLRMLDCRYDPDQAGMFVWTEIPGLYESGFELSDLLLHRAGVFITPGGIFGGAGNRYLRVSLCCTEEKLQQCLSRIRERFIK
jgi:LL-diaminopimelate aminotransferase